MSKDSAASGADPAQPSAGPAHKDETTRRYTRSAVLRIRAAVAAARGQGGQEARPTPQDAEPKADPGPRPEVTQRYADDARARFRADVASAAAGRAAARFRLEDNGPRRSMPAPSMVLFAAQAHESGVRALEPQAPVTRVAQPRKAAVRDADLVGREPGALLFMMPDGALQVVGGAQVRAVAIALVGTPTATLVVDVVLDWGDGDHPADAFRLRPTAAAFARIYAGATLAEAVGAAALDLAAPGAPTLPAPPGFPGPPWPRYVDLRAFESAWLALAPVEDGR